MLQNIILLIGYLASFFLALSLLVNNYIKFRYLNSVGNIIFIIYGVMINAWPIIVTNAVLQMINFYYLYKIHHTTEDFDLIEFSGEERLVYKFLHFYEKDIKRYFPQYVHTNGSNNLRFVVLRDLVLANIFVAELKESGDAFVKLNYTVDKYRDYKVGKFIFNKENKFLVSKGVKRLVYSESIYKQHQKFIMKMGFKKENIGGQECFVLNLI